LIALLFSLSGCDSTRADSESTFVINGVRYDVADLKQYHLPKALREISGLALTDQHELLTHNDEVAVVYRVDYSKGRILGSFRLGQPPLKDDFEGIAISGNRVFLITSTGSLYETRFPLFDDDRATDLVVTYQHYPVTLPCEVEGLAARSSQRLLALCKTLYNTDDVLRIYEWDTDANQYLDEPYVSIDKEGFEGLSTKLKKLRPAGLSVTDQGGLIIVGRNGKKPALIEISPQKTVVALEEFPDHTRHRQPEGIALTRENWLVIADEGVKQNNGKKSKGKLGAYHTK
jgi:hypothetical protein